MKGRDHTRQRSRAEVEGPLPSRVPAPARSGTDDDPAARAAQGVVVRLDHRAGPVSGHRARNQRRTQARRRRRRCCLYLVTAGAGHWRWLDHRQPGRNLVDHRLSPWRRHPRPRQSDRTWRLPPAGPRTAAQRDGDLVPVRADSARRSEVTDRMLIFSERHLGEYARHYNGRRPHRALQLQSPRSDRPVVDLTHERIKRRSVLGGLITEYERAA
jgi:hypothetical protein